MQSMAVQIPVLAGGHPGMLFELPHKMKFIVIAAESGQAMDGHLCRAQIVLRVVNPRGDDILDAGNAEKSFVQMLKMGDA